MSVVAKYFALPPVARLALGYMWTIMARKVHEDSAIIEARAVYAYKLYDTPTKSVESCLLISQVRC